MKNTIKKTVGIILCLIMLMQVTAFAAGAPKNVRWVTGMDLGWETTDDKWIAWDLVPGCDIYIVYAYKDNALVDSWFSETDPGYDSLCFDSIEPVMSIHGTGSYTVKVGSYSGDENDIDSYDSDDPNIPLYGISEMSAPYNYVGGASSENPVDTTVTAPAEPEKPEPSNETPAQEPVPGKRTVFDYAENAETECPLAVKVCYDLDLLSNVYDDANKFVTYDEFNSLWKKNFSKKYDLDSDYAPKTEENIYFGTVNNLIMERLWDGRPLDHRLYDGLSLSAHSEITYSQLAKVLFNLLSCRTIEISGYKADPMTGSLRVIQDESKNVQNGTLFMLGYEKYLADVTVSGDKATVTGKHYTSNTPKGEDVKDVTLTIADSDLKADAKNMILFVKDGEICSAVSNEAAENEKITKDCTLPYTLNLKIGDKAASIRNYRFATDAAPKIVGGRTMLPIRLVAEQLGASVSWSSSTNKVTITKGTKKISIVIGENTATLQEFYLDGEAMAPQTLPLDSPAFIEDGRTYLPVRFVAENLGATVTWNGDTQTVTITRADK